MNSLELTPAMENKAEEALSLAKKAITTLENIEVYQEAGMEITEDIRKLRNQFEALQEKVNALSVNDTPFELITTLAKIREFLEQK